MTPIHYIRFRAMGCTVEAQLETEADGTHILSELPAAAETLEACLSRFRPESELSRMNAVAGEWTQVSEALFKLLVLAKNAARLTEGLFNPLVLPALLAAGYDRSFEALQPGTSGAQTTVADWRGIELKPETRAVRLPVNSGIDLGGIAKGWAAQFLVEQLAAHGPAIVNLGGDIAVTGAPEGQPGWRVDIGEPGTDDDISATVSLKRGSIVTSATDYRRWQTTDGRTQHHIIDPRTGQPADTDVRSATVMHPNGALADAFAKAVLLMSNEAGLRWLDAQWDAAGMIVRADGAILATGRFTPFIVTEGETEHEITA
ncbi:MAG: FAD:protein FMN transferase [Anaerolineae bacterium]|nr:FAD:protein FMN transferase [Anaerolineae bacterium]MCA9908222.1 FAD:protein FMN transferase [Anaerolineae bacterium]